METAAWGFMFCKKTVIFADLKQQLIFKLWVDIISPCTF